MLFIYGNRPLTKIIEIEIGIAIENSCNASMVDPDFDSDFDFETGSSKSRKA